MSIFSIVMLTVIILESTHSLEAVTPTTINSTGEYYITSISGVYTSSDIIQCTLPECNVICDTDSGCYGSNINASISNNLTLSCLTYRSCFSLNTLEGPSDFAEIYCLDDMACRSADFHLENTQKVVMECNDTISNPCYGVYVYTNSITTSGNNFKLICDHTAQSCNYMKFICSDIHHDWYVNGIYDNVLENHILYDDGDPFDGLDDMFRCSGDSRCCPFQYNKTVIYCPLNATNCTINCADYQYVGCAFKYISIYNNSNVTSLTVNCDGSSLCEGAHIEIPHKQLNSLTLYCRFIRSCRYMIVNLNVKNNVNIYCQMDHANPNPCSSAIFNIIGQQSITNYLFITQDYGLQYGAINFINGNVSRIYCDRRGCDHANGNILNMNMVDITCNGEYSCSWAEWNIESNTDVLIECIDFYACGVSDWNINANNIVFDCSSMGQDISCRQITLTANINDSLLITSVAGDDYAFGDYGSASYDSNLNISCLDCINVNRCLRNVTFYCGVASLFSNQCPNCQCMERGYGNEVVTDNPWIECLPTAEPTSNPSPVPSKTPTIYPTINPTNPTKQPSSIPTVNPSMNPSSNPSINPTVNPTIEPTINPTINPTVDPTTLPTGYPSIDPTEIPSTDPSVNPTDYPSVVPTTTTTFNPTMNPTDIPTSNPSSIPSTTTSLITTREVIFKPNEEESNDNFYIYIVIAVILIIVLVVIILIFCIFKKNQPKINHKNMQRIQSHASAPPSIQNNKYQQQIVMVQMPDGRMVHAKLMGNNEPQPQASQLSQNIAPTVPVSNGNNNGNYESTEGEGNNYNSNAHTLQ